MTRKKELPPDRAAVLEKIREYEAKGGECFFCDVEDDPPSRTLTPQDVDYLHESVRYKVNGFFSRGVESLYKGYCKRKFRITVTGEENLAKITGGAVFTSNHFAVTENLAVKIAAEKAPGSHRMYKLVREGNYFMSGMIGWLLKYCDTLPLSSSMATMRMLDRAISQILRRGDFVLIYPEQAMWWNYTKPRPYRIGAYYYAAKNSVPVVPCFVTLHPKREGEEMLPDNIAYSMHILPPIYPDADLKVRDAADRMLEENARLCREVYACVYGETVDNPIR